MGKENDGSFLITKVDREMFVQIERVFLKRVQDILYFLGVRNLSEIRREHLAYLNPEDQEVVQFLAENLADVHQEEVDTSFDGDDFGAID